MKNKKAIMIVALIAVLAVAAGVLAACNVYEWSGIGMGESSADVVSNGGYYVEQGKYVYFINGYVGSVTSNEWGAAEKQAIMRAEKKADGSIDNSTAKVVVPLSIYNEYAGGGFAVYGDWIYYATPNTDRDNSGNASTTHTNFMRTRTDGAVTQRIGVVNSRSSEYLFTPTRVLYSTSSSTVRYFDFSGMSTDKSSDEAAGKSGVLVENATSVLWGYSATQTPGKGNVAEYIFYTETPTGEDSYRHYNNLCAVRYDGSDRRTLATLDSWLEEGDKVEENYEKVFTYTLSDVSFDSATKATLYYTKSIYEGGSSTTVGFYSVVFDTESEFSIKNEVKLASSAPSSFFPLGGDKGVLATKDSNIYLVTAGSVGYTKDNLIIEGTAGVQAVIGGQVFYTDSDGDKLYRINLSVGEGDSDNAKTVIAAGVKSDWLSLEFVGNDLVYFNTEDYNYLYVVDVTSGDVPAEGVMIGVMTAADSEAKAEAEEEEAE